MSVRLARIALFPIKSLDGVEVKAVDVLPSGALRHDRELALVDREGRYVNGKRSAEVHLIRARYDLETGGVGLGVQGLEEEDQFELADLDALADWFSSYFGYAVRVVHDERQGFPDDTSYPGPTLISGATIEAVAGWYEGIDPEGMRRRLRANLEVDGAETFWEDRLYGRKDEVVRFQVGEVAFEGGNPCQRCVVPTRDPVDAAPYAGFQARFMEMRERTLPPWAERSRFDHYYRLSVNTRVAPGLGPQGLGQGEPVRIG